MLSGCTGSSDEAAPIPTIELTTTTAPATTTTIEPTTTPPTTEDPNLAEIREVYEKHFSYLTTHGAILDQTAVEQTAAAPLVQRVVERLEFYESEGITVGPGAYDIRISSIDLDGDTAVITSCDLDGISLLTQTGDEYVPADEVRLIRISTVRHLVNGWRITDTTLSEKATATCGN